MVEDKELLGKEMSLSQRNEFRYDPSRCAELKYEQPKENIYILEIDYNNLKTAEDKYKRREIEKVTINNQDFYICYEEPSDKNEQSHVVYIWPCTWGWSGKIDGYILYVYSKMGLISLLKALLDSSNNLYTFVDKGIYQIKNQLSQ